MPDDVGPARIAPIGKEHALLPALIAGEIRRAILSGRFGPGDRLVEGNLAASFGVSRNPVRHALRQLEAEGFVHIEPRRGASVATIGLADAQEMFEVRGALEALSARLAADRATHHDIADLEQIVVRGEAGARQHRLAELPNLNTEFHMRVAEVAGNRQLARLISDLRDRIQWIYSRHVERRAIHSWDEHRRLFDAIVAHDPDSAASIASDHIAAAKEAFTEGEAGR